MRQFFSKVGAVISSIAFILVIFISMFQNFWLPALGIAAIIALMVWIGYLLNKYDI